MPSRGLDGPLGKGRALRAGLRHQQLWGGGRKAADRGPLEPVGWDGSAASPGVYLGVKTGARGRVLVLVPSSLAADSPVGPPGPISEDGENSEPRTAWGPLGRGSGCGVKGFRSVGCGP